MSSSTSPSPQGRDEDQGCIFEAYRAIGSVTGAAPCSVHARGNQLYVTTQVGRTWHLYTVAKLQLKLVGPQHHGAISHLANKVSAFYLLLLSTLSLQGEE